MIELSIIKYLLIKQNYHNIRDKLDVSDFSKELHPVVRTLDGYFTTTESDRDLTVGDLSNLYFSSNRSKVEFYTEVFQALKDVEANDFSTEKLIDSFRRTRLLRELSVAAYEASEGRREEDYQHLVEQLAQPEQLCDTDEIDDFVTSDLVEIVNSSRSMEGLGWRLGSLNKALGPLRKGNFGFIFARPETGKTTFLASEITWMAQQTSQPILWLNNEEVGTQVMIRCYQSTLGMDNVQLLSDLEKNRETYLSVTKDNIKLKDSASIHYRQVERMCEKFKPSLVVFDQIDKIKGFDSDREDLRLGAIYIWARELAKKYAPVIGVCQADGSGEGVRWLSMANVANAKTSKQAEVDWILGIGKVNDAGYDNLRFMHLSKNKLPGGQDSDPKMRHGRWEVLLDAERARYTDL